MSKLVLIRKLLKISKCQGSPLNPLGGFQPAGWQLGEQDPQLLYPSNSPGEGEPNKGLIQYQ